MSISISELDSRFLDPLAFVPAIARLGGGTLRVDAHGVPVRAAGHHTVVYELRAPSGRITALRIHQRADRERDHLLAERYAALQSDRRLDPLRGPAGPLPQDIRWLPEGVVLPGPEGTRRMIPLVAMERVPGRTLRQTVVRLCHEEDTAHLALIADNWLQAALAMETAGFIHNDLNPDNLIVRPDGTIAVVDLDTAAWPGFSPDHDAPADPATLRHPQGAPQEPARRDRFPALLLWAALRILATHPDLLATDAGSSTGGLLFSGADLRRPAASPLFARLAQTDPSLRLLLEVVHRAIRFSPEDLPALTEIADKLDDLGFPRTAPGYVRTAPPAPPPERPESAVAAWALAAPAPSDEQRTPPSRSAARPQPAPPASTQHQELEALQAALVQRDGREARRILNDGRDHPATQVYATAVHQLTEQEARTAIDRAMRRRDDAALVQAVAEAEIVGIALTADMVSASREARHRMGVRAALSAALRAEDRQTLAELQRSGRLQAIGPLDPAVNRAVARALAWPALQRALDQDDDAAICAAADPALWREAETQPQTLWLRLDLAWQRTRWSQDVRLALRRRDGPALRGLLARAPEGAATRLTEIENRRIQRVISREQATMRLESALREGPDREVVEALAELESSGAPFSEVLDWAAVRGVVDRLSLADALRDAMATDPPDIARIMRMLPAARAALGDLQHAGAEWADLERFVLRAAHLERLREALSSGDDARIAAAAAPDPFLVRNLLTEEESTLVTAALGRTRSPGSRQAS